MHRSKRTPSYGLNILERKYKQFPSNKFIIKSLVDSYIIMNKHTKAMEVIESIPENYNDIKSLYYKIYFHKKKNNVQKYTELANEILLKKLYGLPIEHIDFLKNQCHNSSIETLYKEDWFNLFSNAYYTFPENLREFIKHRTTEVVLVANNYNITEDDLIQNIDNNSLVVFFNRTKFLDENTELFDNITKAFFFRNIKRSPRQHFGLPPHQRKQSYERLIRASKKSATYFLYGSYYPDPINFDSSFIDILINPHDTSVFNEYHSIFKYYPSVELIDEVDSLPSSGFMLFKYFYYSYLYLIMTGYAGFDIKLLGFNDSLFNNFAKIHDWQYERMQFEASPSNVILVPL